MEISTSFRPTRARRSVGVAIALSMPLLAVGSCSSDDGDADDEITDVLVDEDFPGDVFDATCERLEATEGSDRESRAASVLDELIAIGGEEAAIDTLQLATVDRCPDWADAVTSMIEARP